MQSINFTLILFDNTMKKYLVITSVANPTKSLKIIANKSKKNSVNVLIVGDKKSPKNFRLKNSSFFSLKDQGKLNFSYSSKYLDWCNNIVIQLLICYTILYLLLKVYVQYESYLL